MNEVSVLNCECGTELVTREPKGRIKLGRVRDTRVYPNGDVRGYCSSCGKEFTDRVLPVLTTTPKGSKLNL